MTGVAKNTVTKLLVDLGAACGDWQDQELRGLPCKKIQCDEIWSFCYAKEKNLPERMRNARRRLGLDLGGPLCRLEAGRLLDGG